MKKGCQKNNEIIRKSAEKMNSLPSAKHKQTSNEIEKNSLNSEVSKERFNFLRLKKIRKEKVRQEKFNKKIYERKKIRSPFVVGERSAGACFTIKEKRFTRKILQDQH